MQCCTCSKWVNLKCSLLSFSRFRILGSSHYWSCPPCCVPASFGDPIPTSTVTSSSDSSSLYTSTAQSGSLCYYSTPAPPTLAFVPFIHFPRILCIFSLCTTTSCSWPFLFTSCFLFSLTPSRFFNGMLGSPSHEHGTSTLCFVSSR